MLDEITRERIGAEDPDRAKERGLAAFARSEEFIENQENRPLADSKYLQELGSLDGEEDGRFLTQVLEALADEVRALTVRGGMRTREMALCLTSIEQAEHWAIAHGRNTNSHVVIDRRVFKVDPTEDAK